MPENISERSLNLRVQDVSELPQNDSKAIGIFKLKIQQFSEYLFAGVQCIRLGKPIATTV
jgi:hypothetical protein